MANRRDAGRIAGTRAFGHGLGERGPGDRDGKQQLGAQHQEMTLLREIVAVMGVSGRFVRSAADRRHIPCSPLPSPFQELPPVIHGARRPLGVDDEAWTGQGVACLCFSAPVLRGVVSEQDHAVHAHGDVNLVEAFGTHRSRCLEAAKGGMGRSGFEAFA